MSTKKTSHPLDYYGTESELDKSYRAQQKQLDTAKRNAQQNAAISYELLKKYLPVQNKMNGLHGLGVSESAAIDAQNQYVTRMGEISRTHAADSADLLENYRVEKKAEQSDAYEMARLYLENSGELTDGEIDDYLNNKVKGKVSEAQYNSLVGLGDGLKSQAKAARQQMAYEEAMTLLSPDNEAYYTAFRNEAELDDYLSTLYTSDEDDSNDRISAEQYASIVNYANAMRRGLKETWEQNAETEEQEAFEAKDDYSVRTGVYYSDDNGSREHGHDVMIEYYEGNKRRTYKLEYDTEVKDEKIKAVAKKYGKNTAFVYEGDLYTNRGGVCYLLKPKTNDGKHKENYDRIVQRLGG